MHRRAKDFHIGDYVMVCICPERFPKNTLKNLHALKYLEESSCPTNWPIPPLPANLNPILIYLTCLVICILVLFSMWKLSHLTKALLNLLFCLLALLQVILCLRSLLCHYQWMRSKLYLLTSSLLMAVSNVSLLNGRVTQILILLDLPSPN